jgi:surface polysaccharide O-acyltransferase-like enzyme
MAEHAPADNPGKDGRLGALDALRGGAMLLGVYIHAALSYVPTHPAGLPWGVREERTSALLDALFWWIHAFRLPLFFVLAGFFAVRIYDGKGMRGFLSGRARRLLIPFGIANIILLPLCLLYFWACGRVNAHGTAGRIAPFALDAALRHGLIGPLHLWFLEDLFILSVVFAALRRVMSQWAGRPASALPALSAGRRLLLTPVVLAVPTALVLWHDCRPVLAQHNTFVPDLLRLIYFGYFFAIGALVYRHRGGLPQVFANFGSRLALSVLAGCTLLLLLPAHQRGELAGVHRLAFVTSIALLAWLSVFGFTCLALRFFQGRHPVAFYLADASYWVYLAHLPLVCVLQLALCRLGWVPELKCFVVVAAASGLSLLTYHTLVRSTFIGECLHGPRGARGKPRANAPGLALPLPDAQAPRAAA